MGDQQIARHTLLKESHNGIWHRRNSSPHSGHLGDHLLREARLTTALIALAAFGGGIALGSFDTSSVFDHFTNADLGSGAATGDAEEAAGWAIIGLTSALVASVIGAMIGSKMWPRRRSTVTSIHS